jgi:spore coat protein CotF
MMDNRAGMVPVQYIGRAFTRHTEWVDRLYGTGIIWTEENNIQLVPKIAAQKMLKLNSDCYRKATVKDVKSDLKAKAKASSDVQPDTSGIEKMVAGLDDMVVLKNLAKSIDPLKEFEESMSLVDLKNEIVEMVKAKEAKRAENQEADFARMISTGKETADRVAANEKKEMDDSVAKQDLLNTINGMKNKNSLAEYAMSNPDLANITIDKKKTIAEIQKDILEGLRAVGKVY